jgi:hypothetical protein
LGVLPNPKQPVPGAFPGAPHFITLHKLPYIRVIAVTPENILKGRQSSPITKREPGYEIARLTFNI